MKPIYVFIIAFFIILGIIWLASESLYLQEMRLCEHEASHEYCMEKYK